MELIRTLRADFGSAFVFLTHDLGVIAGLCDEVVVMYAGKIVESASVADLFDRPEHPYTWGLLRSLPGRNLDVARLHSVPGAPPSLLHPSQGCRFRARCEYATDACAIEPRLVGVAGPNHRVACHLHALERDAARTVAGLGIPPGTRS